MRRRAPPCFGCAIQSADWRILIDGQACDLRCLLEARLIACRRLVEVISRGGNEGLVRQAFLIDVGEPGVEQGQVGARVDGKVHHAVLAGFDLTGIDGDGAARVDDDDARRGNRLGAELGSFLVHRGAAHIRHPMVQEIVGLGFERVGPDGHDGVGKLGIFVAIVQFAHAHVAGGMDLGIVGRPVVNPDVLHLHGAEIELAGAPGVFVAAAGSAVVKGGDEQSVFPHVVDDRDGDARDQIERIVPARRLHLAVAPHHRIGEALQFGVARAGIAHFRHARAAHGAETRIHHAVLVRLDDDVNVFPVLLDDVVHRGGVPSGGFGRLLLAEIDTELVLIRGRTALLVHGPAIGLVAAADDAVVAGDVELLRILRDDREAVDLTFVSHDFLPQSTLDSRPYKSSSTPSA